MYDIIGEKSVEPLFRPIVKSLESHTLEIWSWINEIVADVSMGELLLTRMTKLLLLYYYYYRIYSNSSRGYYSNKYGIIVTTLQQEEHKIQYSIKV